MARPTPKLVADFETITDPEDCRVWLWGMDTLDMDRFKWGVDIESFCDEVAKYKSVIYYHNLKFDAFFILDYIMKQGYTMTNQRKMKPGQFTTLISDMGKMYSMKICWRTGKTTEFRDSAKKFPGFTVARIAEAFKLPEPKGEIDYDLYRAPGHQPTPEELDYQRRDVHIVCQALKATIDAGMSKLTIGSDSLAEYKEVKGKADFTTLFPVFGQHLDSEIRRAYRGGFTFASPRFAGKLQGCGQVYDVNSLYPYVMRSQVLPYGLPTFQGGKPVLTDKRPLSIFSVTVQGKLKPGHIPCIQIKNNVGFSPTQYLEEIPEPTELMVTNVDWELYQEHYDLEVLHYGGGWLFTAAAGMFNEFVDKWSAIKEASEGGQREISKLILNNLYGKFASNPNVTSKYPVLVDGVVKLKRGPDELRDPVYTPMGVFITSWARDMTVRAAQANYSRFAYADTDSLHLLGDEPPIGLDIHRTRMGAWKHEYDFKQALFVRAKAYFELKVDGEYENHIAGLPTSIAETLTFDDVKDGAIFNGKLTPKHVAGGIVLVDTPYKLKM